MNIFDESNKLLKPLNKIIKNIVMQETRECLRTYKAVVVTAPNSSTGKCVVRLVGQSEELSLPYSSDVSSVPVGSMVWVATTYNSFKNAVVWQKINFK